ncbi:beta-galactosidase [Granulicella sp. L46]|uniref:beta-galactosidase n=1 Tax=Granulicella sp. L46 TaxID=1641865 RepID=UPI0020B11360|nr:beta-galactosidase [Granulicella sp. L46]
MKNAAIVTAALLFLAPFVHAQTTPPAPPPLLLGSAWYPEQWPESRWESDLTLMQQAHLHVVRVGEFAWSSLEPSEGKFDLDWLERAINLAGKHGIYTVLGTPTATPPAWLTTRYPETLRIDENGHRDEHGNRLQYNWSNPKYRELSRIIATKLAERFGHNPYVIGWQIDNEISQTSTDEGTQKQFQSWLQSRYGTLDNLNARWTTAYWSESYSDWSQIPIPKHGGVDSGNPGLLLCWREFISDTWRSYFLNQIDVIRPLSDGRQFFTTNTMGFFQYYDHYVTEAILDLAAWDDYMPDGKVDFIGNGMEHDLARGFKRKNFWVMETQPGNVNWSSVNVALAPGDERALAWHDVAHGADAVNFWQWRSARNGQEQYHGTILGADGTPLPLYPEIQQIGAEFEKLGPLLADTHVVSEVALLHSYESRWAIEWQPQSNKFDPLEEMRRYYAPLRRRVQSVDIVSPDVDLSGYKLVVAPALNLITESQAQALIAYVKGGGNLVLTPRSGMKDADNALQPERQPGPLASLLGGRVEQFYALAAPVAVNGELLQTQATTWGELLSTSAPDTKVVLRYGKANGWLDGKPAVITRRVGKGSITYIGTIFDAAAMQVLADWLLKQANVAAASLIVPDGVEASVRYGKDKAVHIIVNFSEREQTVHLPTAMIDELNQGRSIREVTLPVSGVAVLRESR